MRHSLKLAVSIIAVVAVSVSAVNLIKESPQYESRIVTRIIDGDTVVVEGGDRVRLLDIDTAERGEECYDEAKNRLEELIDGKNVTLEGRGENRDRYGRLLRYIFLDDANINLLLVREGLANLYIFEQGPYHKQFLDAEQLAKSEGGCVWKGI